MRYNVLSENELTRQRIPLIPGESQFEVVAAKETISKSSGNPMIKLELKVWDPKGKQGIVFDYLTSTMQWKLKHFLEAIGLGNRYETGDVDTDELLGRSGKLETHIQKDKSGQYGDQIKVRDYIPATDDEIIPFD